MKNKLKVLREERGWPQERWPIPRRVSRHTVNALETGRYDPALPLALWIARPFDQPIETIFTPP